MRIKLSCSLQQWISIILSLLACVIILSGIVANDHLDSLRAAVACEKLLPVIIRKTATDFGPTFNARNKSAVGVATLLDIIRKASGSKPWKSYPSRLREVQGRKVQLSYNRINFDDLIKGLQSLFENESIKVGKISIQRHGLSRSVMADMLFDTREE